MGEIGFSRFIRFTAGLSLMVLLAACGGGGSSGSHLSASSEEMGVVRVSGRVLDIKDIPVPGATVTFTNDPAVETMTNQWGEFSTKVTPGDHILTVTTDNAILFQKKFTARAGFTAYLGDISPKTPYVINGDDAQASGEEETDAEAISAFWKTFETLYAAKPTGTALTAWFDSHVSNDFLKSGLIKAELITGFENEPDAHVGKAITATIMDEADVKIYPRGYLVRIKGLDSRESVELMVYDGNKWLWCGDHRWLEASIRSHSTMWVETSGMRFSSGFEISLENDDSNYAYNHGVRSAIVSGPGLPASGLIFGYQPGNTWLSLYEAPDSSYYDLSDDSIGGIPENAEYIFTLYSNSPDDLIENGAAGGTVLSVFKETVRKPPVPTALLESSLFASLVEPASHDPATVNFGGLIPISWTIPPDTTSGEVLLLWSASSREYQVEYDNSAGNTSITLDTSGFPEPDGWAGLFIRVTDPYDRDFNMGWFF